MFKDKILAFKKCLSKSKCYWNVLLPFIRVLSYFFKTIEKQKINDYNSRLFSLMTGSLCSRHVNNSFQCGWQPYLDIASFSYHWIAVLKVFSSVWTFSRSTIRCFHLPQYRSISLQKKTCMHFRKMFQGGEHFNSKLILQMYFWIKCYKILKLTRL